MNEEIKEKAEALNKKISALEKSIESGATKEELTNALNEIKEANKGLVSKEELEKLQSIIKEYGEEIEQMKENSNSDTFKKGHLSEFFVKNAKEFQGEAKNDKYYQSKYTLKAPALMATANITPVATGGWSPLFNNYIDTDVANTPKPDNFVMSLVDVRTSDGAEAIYYSDRVNEEGDAEFIAEGALKPLADAEWATKKKNIKEVALRWKFTKRLMQHAPAVEADFREHANELIEQKMDDVALTGDEGTNANEFDGLATLSDAFVVPTALANYYQDANIYDAINAVATFVRLNNFKGQLTCVLNTVWKAKMQGIKETTTGAYIVPPFVSPDGNTVGEVRVVFQNKMPEDKILLGDMMKYKIVIAENIEYDEGYENDDFSKNLVSRKLEAFLGSYKKDSDAGSIIYDDIATVLTAIQTV
jgi:HK97 family phage major capsid protein